MTISPQQLRAGMPWDKIQDGLVQWVKDTTGLEAIYARTGNTIQPERPYAAIDIISGPIPVGYDGEAYRDASGDADVEPGEEMQKVVFGTRKLGVQVTFFSGGNDPLTGGPVAQNFEDSAMSYASAFHLSGSLEQTREMLRSFKMSLASLGKPVPLPYSEDAAWVSAVAVEFQIYFVFRVTGAETTGYVEEVIGTGTETDSNISIPFDVKGTA